jgi:hypothetical protein
MFAPKTNQGGGTRGCASQQPDRALTLSAVGATRRLSWENRVIVQAELDEEEDLRGRSRFTGRPNATVWLGTVQEIQEPINDLAKHGATVGWKTLWKRADDRQ